MKVLKELGSHFLKHEDFLQAHEHLSRAMEIDPDDDELKLAYADVSLKMSQMDAVSVRGKKDRLHLYEVVELKNPLLATDTIPRELHEKYHQSVDETFGFPEDILLPMEVVDGSVGHARVVGFFCYAVADLLGLNTQEKLEILQAGYLADQPDDRLTRGDSHPHLPGVLTV